MIKALGAKKNPKAERVSANFEQLALSNMLLTEAIFELLAEKGWLTGAEVLERIEKLRNETRLSHLPRLQ